MTPVPPHLPESLTCFQCEYPLRNLPPDGACPECGYNIADSLAQLPTHLYIHTESVYARYLTILGYACTARDAALSFLFITQPPDATAYAAGVIGVIEILVVFTLLLPLTFDPGALRPADTAQSILYLRKGAFFAAIALPLFSICCFCLSPGISLCLLSLLATAHILVWLAAMQRVRLLAQRLRFTTSNISLMIAQAFTLLFLIAFIGVCLYSTDLKFLAKVIAFKSGGFLAFISLAASISMTVGASAIFFKRQLSNPSPTPPSP